MSKAEKTVKLNNTEYVITMFNPDDGFEVLLKLSKFIGPIITELSGLAGDDINKEVNMKDFALIGQRLFQGFNIPETKDLVKSLLACVIYKTSIVGQNLSGIEPLKGNYGDIIRLCKEVVDHNRFLESLGAIKELMPQG